MVKNTVWLCTALLNTQIVEVIIKNIYWVTKYEVTLQTALGCWCYFVYLPGILIYLRSHCGCIFVPFSCFQ